MKTTKQHAVITGGTGCLGVAIAAALQSPDWSIAAPSSRELDVRNAAEVNRYFDRRPIDLLVCSAGVIRDVPLARVTESIWNELWDINFQGAASCAEAVLPVMLGKKVGHIIFISSYSAIHPPLGQVAYAAAKAALIGLGADFAMRYGSSNIRVNVVLPGFLETRMTENVTSCRRAEISAAHVLGRFNTCRETAGFIRFLHHELPHTSGQVYQLDSRVNFP